MTSSDTNFGKIIAGTIPILLTRIIVMTLGLVIFFQAGCSKTKWQECKPVSVNTEMSVLWPLCQKALKDRGFQLDYVNLHEGHIETYPLISKQWFEFWHNDVVDCEGLLESSTHTIQRQANLDISRLDDNRHEIKCRVNVERLSLEQDFSGTSVRARDIFSNVNMQDYKPDNSTESKRWIPLGNDAALENAIIQSIVNQL